MEAFRSGAALYEIFANAERRLEREGPFLEDVLRRAPGRRALDLACGTGLHAEFLAQHGADVLALDLSPDMIAYAETHRPHPEVRYQTGDMRQPPEGPWDLVVCLGNSFCLLESLDDVETTLRGVYASLAPGGLFLVQILNYLAPAAQNPRHRVESKSLEKTEIVAVKNLVPHGNRTLLSLTYHIIEGDRHSSISEAAVLQNLTTEQVVGGAQQCGFRTEYWGGYDRSAFDPEASTDLLCLFEKPS